MVPPSNAQSSPKRFNGHEGAADTSMARHLVSAAPLRTKQAADELAATLEDLGADPCVVRAAKAASTPSSDRRQAE